MNAFPKNIFLKMKEAEKGVSVYLAIIVMFIILGIGLTLSIILIGQIRIIRGMRGSIIAFYAADTGIEWAMYQDRKGEGLVPGTYYYGFLNIDGDSTTPSGSCPDSLATTDPDDACYIVIKNASIKSSGVYKEVHRAIEINF